MKTLIIMAFLVLFLGCGMTRELDAFTGSWIETTSESTSMMLLHGDGTCSIYLKIGKRNSQTWTGYWKMERTHLFLLDSNNRAVSMGYITGRGLIDVNVFGELHYFHKYGSEPYQGTL